MTCIKGQSVRLTPAAAALRRGQLARESAKVVSLVYLDQPEGQRGVQLDREVGGSKWWTESDLEAAT